MTKHALVLAAVLAPLAALAQTSVPEPAPPQQQPQAQPPPQQPPQQQPQAQPPPQQPAQQQPQAQQPPQQPPQQAQAQPPPAPTTSATTPPAPANYQREKPRRSPLAIVFTDAAFGGAAGFLVGTGVALVNQGGNWGKDMMVGAGVGIIIGAAVGVAHAAIETRNAERAQAAALAPPRSGLALDGLGSTARDPVIRKAPFLAWGGRF